MSQRKHSEANGLTAEWTAEKLEHLTDEQMEELKQRLEDLKDARITKQRREREKELGLQPADYCNHMFIHWQHPPEDVDSAYGHLAIVMEHLEAIFECLVHQEETGTTGSLIVLGDDLIQEARRRLELLMNMWRIEKQARTKQNEAQASREEG